MSSHIFGEIIEPSTRALIDEDEEEYPEFKEFPTPQWEGVDLPEQIDALIFLETNNLKRIAHDCLLCDTKPISTISKAGVEVFETNKNQYIVIWQNLKDVSSGEVVQYFEKWIERAQKLYCITSDLLSHYQNNFTEISGSVVRTLSTDSFFSYTKLESPNLVTGLGANVLSYCIHVGIKCTLFVAYTDTLSLDSLNVRPILELFKKIHVPVKSLAIKPSISSNNLYM